MDVAVGDNENSKMQKDPVKSTTRTNHHSDVTTGWTPFLFTGNHINTTTRHTPTRNDISKYK